MGPDHLAGRRGAAVAVELPPQAEVHWVLHRDKSEATGGVSSPCGAGARFGGSMWRDPLHFRATLGAGHGNGTGDICQGTARPLAKSGFRSRVPSQSGTPL
ncbi:hypothetical protein GCM10027570_24120 [Streptomonospora sediminis]